MLDINLWRAADKKSSFIIKQWITPEGGEHTLEEHIKVNPVYQYLDKEVLPEIIKKEYGEGKTFLKVLFTFKGGMLGEYDLSYNKEKIKDFHEEDLLSWESLRFCIEMCMGETHAYVTGEKVA